LVRNVRKAAADMLPPIAFALDDEARAAVLDGGRSSLFEEVQRLGADLEMQTDDEACLPLAVPDWQSDRFDLMAFDESVRRMGARRGRCRIRLTISNAPGERPGGREILDALGQVITRCQRFLRWRNAASTNPHFDRALALHERLHDRTKPLVVADYEHALDTWRWTLRLDAHASLAVQIAALFHDVERLYAEPDVRIEHRAPDYRAFKTAHAASGSELVAVFMAEIGMPLVPSLRICELVARHELGGEDGLGKSCAELVRERALVNDADALSFFSLNASGFLNYFGAEHTARKVAYTWRRLSSQGRRELGQVKMAAPIRAFLDQATGGTSGDQVSVEVLREEARP